MSDDDPVGWVTLGQARQLWSGAPLDDPLLTVYLQAAYEQCAAYLGESSTPTSDVPARLMVAQVQQARTTFQAKDRDGDVLGFDDGYAIRIRPLAADVKALLRPPTGVPYAR